MKIPKFFQKKKIRAATATRRAEPEYADAPDIKLSSAVIVVVVLHLVAVGGIYAFNSIKTNHPTTDEIVSKTVSTKSESERSDETKPTVTNASNSGAPKIYRIKSGDTLTKIAGTNGVSVNDLEETNGLKNVMTLRPGQEIKIPAKSVAKPVSTEAHKLASVKTTPSAIKDSGEIYTVAKGDTPLLIAKKQHINPDELLRLNKIDDPKKLKPGQSLRLPAKHKSDVALSK